ncbi:hypothetical protein WK52_16065 [Burkholderia multivorans]|nr:hypothetical protein [Burkholderia multivorans]KVT44167.1 hypothetical protein WK52_16065 [Burkholderia multivorans]
MATPPRNQPDRAGRAIPGNQPFNLPSTDLESLRGSPRHQTLLDHGFHDLQTIQLAHAHGDRLGVVGHEKLLVDQQKPLRMNQSAANYDISTLPSYDITTLLLHRFR